MVFHWRYSELTKISYFFISPLIIEIASLTVVINCAGKIIVEFFSTLIYAIVCKVRSCKATGCKAIKSAASPSLTAA